MLTIPAPAKINLTLEILGKRADGFHEIRSVVQTIGLCDMVHFRESPELEIFSDPPDWKAVDSLVSQAVKITRKKTGCSEGAMITLGKNIPLGAGLGGDSSDAAATLRGLNRLWKLGLARDELSNMASQLSSDVALFLHGGTLGLSGRGEVVSPLMPIDNVWVVLLIPQIPQVSNKTEKLYHSVTSESYTRGQFTENMIRRLNTVGSIEPGMMFNAFDEVAFGYFNGLDVYRERFVDCGADNIHVAGSGPVLFTITPEITSAENIYRKLKRRNLEAYLCNTLGPIL